VAERFQKNVIEAQDGQQRAHNEAVNFRSEAASLRESLDIEIARSTRIEEQLIELQRTMDETVKELEETIKVTRVHLAHDIEIMRGRLIESLQVNIERLETGLSAITQEVPLIQVMTQRAEIVIDDLQTELKNLERKN
jgi:LPS O-antigen subunit length determinant protein (WzzB/FepE family)